MRHLEAEWSTSQGMVKIFTIDREDIDGRESDEPPAWELVFISHGGVRERETLIDCAYNRFDGLSQEDEILLETCPANEETVVAALMDYIRTYNK